MMKAKIMLIKKIQLAKSRSGYFTEGVVSVSVGSMVAK